MRRLVLGIAAVVFVLTLSPAMAGDTIFEKLQKSSQEAVRRTQMVLNKPAHAANPKNWTQYCPAGDPGPCVPAPGPD
jgi:hypothetical protein